MIDLLPCPFCGGRVEMSRNGGSYGYTPPSVGVACCNTVMSEYTEEWEQGRGHYSVEEEAIYKLAKRWNTRAPIVTEDANE